MINQVDIRPNQKQNKFKYVYHETVSKKCIAGNEKKSFACIQI